MSRRKRTLLAVGMLVVVTGMGMLGVRWLLVPPPLSPDVTIQHFRRLTAGMTEQECDAILRGNGVEKETDIGEPRVVTWAQVNCMTVLVEFEDDRLTKASFLQPAGGSYETVEEIHWRQSSILDRLRRWFGL